MAWDDIARQDHRRVCARYPSDMTDREWAIIAPLLPPARSGGRPRTVDVRAVVDAILFIASSGCQWRMLPKDFPPRSTVTAAVGGPRTGRKPSKAPAPGLSWPASGSSHAGSQGTAIKP